MIALPIKLGEDGFTIVDNEGTVLARYIFNTDPGHMREQTERASELVELVNRSVVGEPVSME